MDPSPRSEKQQQARSTGIVSAAIMCSRLLGLIREQILLAMFGGSKVMDCFVMAFRTPNMMRDLFAEGALSTAFVTTFSKKLKTEGQESAWTLAQKMATLLTVFMSIIVILGIIFAPYIIGLLAYWWPQDKIDLTVMLARIMYPFIGIVSLSALVMGMLNSQRVFGIPALASSFFNLGSIIGGLIIGWYLDPNFGERSIIGFAFGTLVGGLAQLGVQLPSLFKLGFRPRLDFNWRDSGVRKILSLMGPAVVAGSAVQVNVLLNSMFASNIEGDGPVTWLGAAFRLMQLPLGVFGVAVAMVTLPAISREATHGPTKNFCSLLSNGIQQVMLWTIPSAVGLFLLADPIISLVFERGRFDAHDTEMTALALRYYAVGLVFYACMKVLQPAFYAIDKKYVPMLVSFGAIGLNAGLNSLFVIVFDLGHEFLALSTGLIAAANFIILYVVMWKAVGNMRTPEMVIVIGKLFLSADALALVCWLSLKTLLAGYTDYNIVLKILTLGFTIALGCAAFFGTAIALKVDQAKDLLDMVRSRLPKRWFP